MTVSLKRLLNSFVNPPGGQSGSSGITAYLQRTHQTEKWDFLLISAHNRLVTEERTTGFVWLSGLCSDDVLLVANDNSFHSRYFVWSHLARYLVSGDCKHVMFGRCHKDLLLQQQFWLSVGWYCHARVFVTVVMLDGLHANNCGDFLTLYLYFGVNLLGG